MTQQGVNRSLVRARSHVQITRLSPVEKVVMIGDCHGSAYTFVRHLFRFDRLGILNLNTLQLSPGYRLVFLGDVVDRGAFSFELSLMILQLIQINNADYADPRVIYNRGNHEELEINQAYGLKDELLKRCHTKGGGGADLFEAINQWYLWLPSAVVLTVTLADSTRYRYWLCHGGFDPSQLQANSKLTVALNQAAGAEGVVVVMLMDDDQQHNLRWSDFDNTGPASVQPLPNEERGIGRDYQSHHVHRFCQAQQINLIIRGHQDNYDNNYLFANNYVPVKAEAPVGLDSPYPGFGLNYSAGLTQSPLMGVNGQWFVIMRHSAPILKIGCRDHWLD